MLELRPTAIPDLMIVSTRWFEDDRGRFTESYNAERFHQAGLPASFQQDNIAVSKQAGTLRGLHFQTPPLAQAKLVRVGRGAVYDVAVDLRAESPSYGQWFGLVLSAENRLQLYIPAGFAHGYLTLNDDTEFLYKVDAPYAPAQESGILWNDPTLAIPWPLSGGTPHLAPRDQTLPRLSELPRRSDWERRR